MLLVFRAVVVAGHLVLRCSFRRGLLRFVVVVFACLCVHGGGVSSFIVLLLSVVARCFRCVVVF